MFLFLALGVRKHPCSLIYEPLGEVGGAIIDPLLWQLLVAQWSSCLLACECSQLLIRLLWSWECDETVLPALILGILVEENNRTKTSIRKIWAKFLHFHQSQLHTNSPCIPLSNTKTTPQVKHAENTPFCFYIGDASFFSSLQKKQTKRHKPSPCSPFGCCCFRSSWERRSKKLWRRRRGRSRVARSSGGEEMVWLC